MRNKKRNDYYVSQRINSIINSIPNNPFIGFSSTIKPIDKIDRLENWSGSDYSNYSDYPNDP